MKMKQSPLFWNRSGEAQPFDRLSVYELVWLLPLFLFKKINFRTWIVTRQAAHFKGINALNVWLKLPGVPPCAFYYLKRAITLQTHCLCHWTWSSLLLPSLFRSSQYPHKYRTVYEKIIGPRATLRTALSVGEVMTIVQVLICNRESLNDLWPGTRLQTQGELSKTLSFRVKLTLLVLARENCQGSCKSQVKCSPNADGCTNFSFFP